MAKKEINIFGTSFLDLLSGALAAVIILFVIVPKMTSEQQDALEEIDRLNVQVDQLEEIMERIQTSVPQDVYEEVRQQLEQLQQTITDLTSQVENLQQRLASSESENERLRSQVAEQSAEIERLRQENRRLQEQVQSLQAQQPQQSGRGISDGKIFGIDAEVGVVCFWRENVDVDLFVKNLATGETCYFRNKETEFGTLNEDITRRDARNTDRFELFYQSEVIPGRYEISLVYYEDNTNQHTRANVEGYMVMHPGKHNQIKIPYPNTTLSENGRQPVVLGVLTVTSDSISFQ